MEGLHLKWLGSKSLTTITLSSGEEFSSVTTGDWTFVRSDTSLVAFKIDSGGNFRVIKQYENVFNTPHYYRFFPWTVCQMKSDGKFVLVVRDLEGMAAYELLESNKVSKMRIEMVDVAAEKFDEETPENIVTIINLRKSDGILVKITEYGVEQMYKLNLATRHKILAQVGAGDETNYLEAAGLSDYHFFRVSGNKFIGYTLNSNFDENETIIADKIEDQVPLEVLQVFATKLNSLNVYLFASTLGLYIYTLEQKLLKHVCLNQHFSTNEGWTKNHWKTVKIVEVNSIPHIIFTGPKGVGVSKINENCENVRILDAEFPLEQRHGTVLAVNILSGGKLELLCLNSNSIDSITVGVQEPAKIVTTAKKPTVVPNYSSMVSLDIRFHVTSQPPVKPSLWLGETLDTASIADGVDRTTGQLSFTLPIIDLRSKFGVPIRHTFYFNQPEDGTGVDPGVLGMYWSRSMDFIYVDRKDTVFEDEFEYFLVSDGAKVKLEWVSSEAGMEVFQFEDTVIKYHKKVDSGMWEVVTKDLVCWYGESESSIRWTLGWPNWNGKGADEESVLKRPLEWHLSRAKTAVGDSVVQYEYESETVTVKDKVSYTKDIVLKSIIDRSTGISVNFYYKVNEKSIARETTSKLEVVFKDTSLLSGFNVESNDFIQNVTIEYSSEMFLTKIIDASKDIITFVYNNSKVTKINLPSGEVIHYTYGTLTLSKEHLAKKFKDTTILFPGPSYTIVSRLEGNRTIIMQLLDVNASEDMALEVTLSVKLTEDITNLNILTQQKYFILNVKSKNKNTIVIYMKNENTGKWMEKFLQDYQEFANVIATEYYWMILAKNSNGFIKLFYFKIDYAQFKYTIYDKELRTQSSYGITFIHKGLVYYCNNGVYVLRLLKTFHDIQISEVDYVSRTKSTIDQLDIPSYPDEKQEDVECYRRSLEKTLLNGIIVFKNVVIVRELTLTGSKLEVVLNIFTLDVNYKVTSTSMELPGGIDLNEWNLRLSVKPNYYEHDFLLKFEHDNWVWKLKVKEHKTREPNREKFEKFVLGFLKLPLDFEQFNLFQAGDAVICNSYKLFFDGQRFKSEPIPVEETKIKQLNLQIAKRIWMKKDSTDGEVKLMVDNGATKSLLVSRLDHLILKPPFYVAFKVGEIHLLVKLEQSGTTVSEILNVQGHILKFSTERLLVTHYNRQVIITPIRAIDINNNFKVNVIVSEKRGTSKVSYIYAPESSLVTGSDVAFKRVKIVPNGDFNYGSFEQVTNFRDRSRTINVLDSQNKTVVKDYKGPKSDRDKRVPLNGTFVLYDKYWRNVISDFRPYAIDSQQVDFVGFERYENLKSRKWNLDESKIQRKMFAGTGKSFYKLDAKDLQGSYTLKEFQQSHIISSWIRTEKGLSINSETDILTVTVGGKPLKAHVRDQINDWFHIEVLISPDNSARSNQKITITFKKGSHSYVDIDHIRLSPLDFNFRAIIFDEFRNNPIAVLRHNGRTVQYLYDGFGRKIGEVDERGSVTKLVIYSKQPAKNGISSVVNLQPVSGFVESMSPYTVGLIWDFGNIKNWRFSLKRVSIESGSGTMKYKQSLKDCSNIGVRLMIIRSQSGTLKIKFSSSDPGIDVSSLMSGTYGEIAVVRYKKFFSVWIDGHLKKEELNHWSQSRELSIEVSGEVELSDVVVMKDVALLVEYNDSKGQPVQQISVEDDEYISMRGFVYDAVQRESVETVWTRHRIDELRMDVFEYKSDYVNLKGGKVSGSIVTSTKPSYQGFPFTMTVYLDCPLPIRQKVGIPGKENNIDSSRAVAYSKSTDNNFLMVLFSSTDGFRYEEQHLPNGANNTQVYDNRDRKVAEYVSVPKYDNILTTYQYDEAGNVIEVLQPNFHHAVDTRAKAAKFDEFLKGLSEAGKSLRIKQRERKQFDSARQITLKQTPDAGLYRFLYDDFRQLRFVVHYTAEDIIDKVFFHKYTSSGDVFEFGVLYNERSLEQLKKYTNDPAYPRDKANYIQFDYGNIDYYSRYRNRKQSSLKVDKTGSTTETLYFNEDGNVLLKSYVNPLHANKTIDVAFIYERNIVKEIVYPAEFQGSNLVVSYTYNFKGQVIAIGTRAKPRYFAELRQNPLGKVEEIWYIPGDKHNFTVRLRYNAAGNMVSMDSKFLKEDLDYEAGKGYNAYNSGDGSILRTTFEAKWHDKCNRKLLKISIGELIKSELKFSVANKCIDELRKKGYIDEASSPFKTMRKETAGDPCLSGSTFRKLSSILIGKAFPKKYGHAYDYGSHGEMTIAKYFSGSEDPAVNIQGNRMTMIADACPGDVESFDIDPNGNHKLFYTGNVRHKLTYKEHTNQIGTVQLGANGKVYTFEHNSEGNVIGAEYKNITSLEYDHLVDRVSKITMKGGTIIDLGYDIRGERTFKKVTAPSGKITETYYIRDIKARCLMDMKFIYQDRSMMKPLITLTTYIHGPLGLLGFIRNNVFYSVIADHEGSTRLVVKSGEVVAAYDYLPYGGRMRFYNSDPDGHVAYQYTGQEFDEETGLYNYHARLYDPELGRFYQTDPKEEYPSPYKYAGNSPVMMTDPDGELALTVVCVITAIVGAYLAASANSNSWDPIKWNWKSGQLWLAMIGGTFAGAMLPIGAVESFSVFASIGGALFASAATASLVMAGTYLGMAGASNDFNPANWDLSSPALYSGMLNGASLAINIPSGVVGISRAISAVTTSKTVFATATFGTSLLFGYGSALLENDMTWNPAQWDWNAQTVFALFEGATFVFMETGAFIKRGPQKSLFKHKFPGISTAPTKRWVKRFEQSDCQYEVIQNGLQDDICKIRWRQILTGSTDLIRPAIPPPGLTKEFIAGLPEVKQLNATVVIPDVMLREEYSMYKGYFSKLEAIPLNATMVSKANRRVKRFSSATSGGASLFDNIRRFFQFRQNFLTNDKSTTEDPSTDVIEHAKRPTPKPIKIHSLTNCIAMNTDRAVYECFQSTAKVLLFAQNPSVEPGSAPTRIDRCVPLHWHGQPSVGCQGQQFGFIYTPYEAPKIFSFLDGWLMLARVGLQVVENFRQVEEKLEQVCWDEEDVGKYYEQLGEIEEVLHGNKRESLKWAKLQLEEMRSDLEDFRSRSSMTSLVKMVFEEKLAALKDDLLEEIKYDSDRIIW